MKNNENIFCEKSGKLNWNDTPLFTHDEIRSTDNAPLQISDRLNPQISNLHPPPINAAPQKTADSFDRSLPSTDINLLNAENVEFHRKENVDLHWKEEKEEIEPPVTEKSKRTEKAEQGVSYPQRKSRKKPPVKKIRSQKRNVVPLKLFVSAMEKIELEKRAAGRNCSLSNYIRLNLGLAPNEAGRKKRNVTAAFDLSELGLDLEFDSEG